ncbi:MAG: 2TM domain-containing protein [Limnoraphis robusta]|uniref:2TM domain-containing protein n=1 Tax=Limnoraphis robusta CCNP1315 TaxID=3110306 RepID=A0ABU5U3D2_9CYAN|nr:2TM domain-containing protein [Limnoraphis robusta]MEA5500511.1 2TM domain-containing protein [Limnoraphis robusta BA-68 BA1]MEA5521707.1 2TM domain-containing protein [Limnoraphis robusta CCNP1315]MEA5543158.1 2TM domain-containing protein [Limnoraphis robusta Tam1]MEA5548811.1 2TM domain-containing protein [Limnoraphis robusta CCNP1324]
METSENSITQQTYIQQEAQEILKIAFAKKDEDGELSRSQLMEIAAELGISPGELALAEQEWHLSRQDSHEKLIFNAQRHQKLRQDLMKFGIVSAFLILLNLVTTQGISFALSIMLIWGLFLALSAWRTYQTEGEEYEKAFSRWKIKKQLGQSFNTIAEKVLKGWQS